MIVGQRKALYLAVRDWRRATRHTALDGLLTGATRFAWPRAGPGAADPTDDDPGAWEGLMGDASE